MSQQGFANFPEIIAEYPGHQPPTGSAGTESEKEEQREPRGSLCGDNEELNDAGCQIQTMP
jgi:hypothetical protein